MSFETHLSVGVDHPVFSRLSLGAFGLWMLAGIWTWTNRSPGFVPTAAASEIDPCGDLVAELVEAGVWSSAVGGYRMEYGPSTDFPLPVWRYGSEPAANGWFEVIPEPDL